MHSISIAHIDDFTLELKCQWTLKKDAEKNRKSVGWKGVVSKVPLLRMALHFVGVECFYN